MNSSMCPDQLAQDHADDDIPTFDGKPHIPSLRDVLAKIARLDKNKQYHSLASGCAGSASPLYGAHVWYENNTVHAGMTDGVVRFNVDDRGIVQWMPIPVPRDEVERIIRQCRNKEDTFQQMLKDRTVNN